MPFDGDGCSENAAYSMTTARKIRVLIVDDHVMVRQGLRAVLQSYPNIDVVGEAGNGEEAISSVAKLRPAIVVMDIGMPTLDGIGATRLIKMQYPQIAVLGLSVNAPTYQVEAMVKAGAFDVITKEKAVDELYSAIQKAIAAIQPILILEEGPSENASAAEVPQKFDVLSAKDTKI
jgi:DNA-binding NarL/FixJ family response regulator